MNLSPFVPLEIRYALRHRRLPGPSTFTGRVARRMRVERGDLLRHVCDKLWMKEFAESSGADVLVPTTHWFVSDLTNMANKAWPDQWVLKPNHLSGVVEFGSGRPELSRHQLAKWRRWAQRRHPIRAEWAYGEARRGLLLEERIGTPDEVPIDYKFFVFQGQVRAIQVDTGRFTVHRRSLYDRHWNLLPVRYGYPSAGEVERPENLEAMLDAAQTLGRQFNFIRVDLYSVQGKTWFGELTPYPDGAVLPIKPRTYDQWLGSFWPRQS